MLCKENLVCNFWNSRLKAPSIGRAWWAWCVQKLLLEPKNRCWDRKNGKISRFIRFFGVFSQFFHKVHEFFHKCDVCFGSNQGCRKCRLSFCIPSQINEPYFEMCPSIFWGPSKKTTINRQRPKEPWTQRTRQVSLEGQNLILMGEGCNGCLVWG